MDKEHKKQTSGKTEAKKFLEKIVINAGIGRLSQQPSFEQKILPQLMGDLAAISGQKPEIRKAKKSIAGFKIREGQIIGLRVTLRRAKMVDFLERLITIVLPRVRDFRGLDQAFIDAGGTFNVGFREQLVFPEINPETSQVLFSFGVNLVPREKNRAAAVEAYRRFGIPFSREPGGKR